MLIGRDLNNGSIYVGRAYYKGQLLPGKAKPAENVIFVTNAGVEFQVDKFELLYGSKHLRWQNSSGVSVLPEKVVQGGYAADGEKLYIGQHKIDDIFLPGKVHPSVGLLFVALHYEKYFNEYEILVEC